MWRRYLWRHGRKWNYVYTGVMLLICTSCVPSIMLSSKVSDETIQDIKTINSTILKSDSLWFEARVWPSGKVTYYPKNLVLSSISAETVDRLSEFINANDASLIKRLFYKHNMKEIFVREKYAIFYVLKTTREIPLVTSYSESLVVQYLTDKRTWSREYSTGKVKRVIEPEWSVFLSHNSLRWRPI